MVGDPSLRPTATTGASAFMVGPYEDDWVNAIERGFCSTPGQFDPQPDCPTGTCTWPAFRSVGWCSKCEDATPYAELSNCDIGQMLGNHSNVNTTACQITYGHGQPTDVYRGGPQSWNVDESRLGGIDPYTPTTKSESMFITKDAVWVLDSVDAAWYEWMSNTSDVPRDTTYLGVVNPVMTLGYASVDFLDTDDYARGLRITSAEECVLSLCDMETRVSTENGTSKTVMPDSSFGVISYTYTRQETTSFNLSDPKLNLAGGYGDFSWMSCWSQDIASRENQVATSGNANMTDKFFCPLGLLNDYVYTWTPIVTFATTLSSHITGSAAAWYCNNTSSGQLVEGPRCQIGSDLTGWLVKGKLNYTSPSVQYIASTNLSYVLEGVAAGLSSLGLADNKSTFAIDGTAFGSQTYVHVRYAWLILPCVLELGGITALLMAIIASRRHNIEPWKSSILALLYRGPDFSKSVRESAPGTVSGLVNLASETNVRLLYSANTKRSTMKQM